MLPQKPKKNAKPELMEVLIEDFQTKKKAEQVKFLRKNEKTNLGQQMS